jgi:hypothetical protein
VALLGFDDVRGELSQWPPLGLIMNFANITKRNCILKYSFYRPYFEESRLSQSLHKKNVVPS